ncbi:MAG: heme lyase CcmF/NrfE family subunit [Anaerolineae bacterium]|nr:heme lyase CcmF/NrfE family subunit [Anaerolineae bacterium]
MILADIGYGTLVLTMAVGLWSAFAALVGAARRRPEMVASARNALFVTAGLSTLASAILLALLFTHEFQVRYVYEHVSTYLAAPYVLSAFWAGLEGSQLLWLWMLTLFSALLLLRPPTWDRELRPYAMVILAITQSFFALLLVTLTNPFELMPTTPAEGISLNPLLQNFWMIIHPPIIFAAYALWTIPFAYAFAALVTGRLDATWLSGSRRWTLAAWASLGIGILVGAWWAYLELGWGGYWGWDPVENSSLIPWLVSTAFVHSAIIQQRRDMFRGWNILLAMVTFVLTVFATFVTRSGLIQSVHAFAQSPIGYYYLGYMLVVLVATVGLMLARRREMEGEGQLGDLLSREFVFLLTNLLFLGSAAAVLLGTLWPTFTEAVRDVPTSLGPENYNRFMGPLGLILTVLIGVCPLVDWRHIEAERLLRNMWVQAVVAAVTAVVLLLLGVSEMWAVISFAVVAFVAATIVLQFVQGAAARMRTTGENPFTALARAIGKNRRRYGGQIIHFSILLIVAGITGSQAYQTEVQVALAQGEEVEVGGYTIAYEDYTYRRIEEEGNKVLNQAVVDVYRDDRLVATMRPERNLHSNVQGAVSEVALRSNLKEDLYVVLSSLEPDGLAAFQVLITPLVVWLWIGGVVLLVGTLIAAWPTSSARSTGYPGQQQEES